MKNLPSFTIHGRCAFELECSCGRKFAAARETNRPQFIWAEIVEGEVIAKMLGHIRVKHPDFYARLNLRARRMAMSHVGLGYLDSEWPTKQYGEHRRASWREKALREYIREGRLGELYRKGNYW